MDCIETNLICTDLFITYIDGAPYWKCLVCERLSRKKRDKPPIRQCGKHGLGTFVLNVTSSFGISPCGGCKDRVMDWDDWTDIWLRI